MPDPSRTVKPLIALVVGSAIFSDYWEYSRAYHSNPQAWSEKMQAPPPFEHYQVGIPRLAALLEQHAHVALRHAFTLIDLISAFIAAYVLYSVLEQTRAFHRAGAGLRWVAAAAFTFLLQFYLTWITWGQRAETMATTAGLILALWLLCAPASDRRGMPAFLRATAILALAAAQAFVRADVALALHLGVLLACLRSGTGFALSRIRQAITSGISILIVLPIQYSALHRFPEAGAGQTPVLALKQNLTSVTGWLPFAAFMLPSIWLIATSAIGRVKAEGPWLGLLIGATLYLIAWFAFGRIEEVNAFLPYAVALIPLACVTVMQLVPQEFTVES